jgi:hypothetical protein
LPGQLYLPSFLLDLPLSGLSGLSGILLVCPTRAASSVAGPVPSPSCGEQHPVKRTPSSGMLLRVALVRTYVSEGGSASIIRLARISEMSC